MTPKALICIRYKLSVAGSATSLAANIPTQSRKQLVIQNLPWLNMETDEEYETGWVCSSTAKNKIEGEVAKKTSTKDQKVL